MLTREEARKYWQEKQRKANETMLAHQKYGGALIEVASMVLEDGLNPNPEFKARLDAAVELYHRLCEDYQLVHIYVPGSLHRTGDKSDKCSLSEAGCRYLQKRGIPADVLFGNEMNIRYKGEDGVFNSADECFVTAQIFIDGHYKELHCCCSPIQVTRKWFYYLEFGVEGLIHSVPFAGSDVMDIVTEQLRGVENVIYNDHSAQRHDSEVWINSRLERKG